jgi:hypothetical protein
MFAVMKIFVTDISASTGRKMCGKPGKGRHGTSHYASHVSKIKSFLPIAAETSLTKV